MRLLAITFLFLLTPELAAHELLVVAKIEGERVRVEVFYDDDSPADGAKIQIFDANGEIVAECTTDDNGVGHLPRPKTGEYTVRAKSIGHIGKTTLTENAPSREELTRTNWVGVSLGLGVILGISFGWRAMRKSGRQGE